MSAGFSGGAGGTMHQDLKIEVIFKGLGLIFEINKCC